MSNHHHPSPLEAQAEPNDDVDEPPPPPPPPPPRKTTDSQLVYGALVRGGHRGVPSSRPQTVVHLEQGQPLDFSVYDFPSLGTTTPESLGEFGYCEGDPLASTTASITVPRSHLQTRRRRHPHREQDQDQNQGQHQGSHHPRRHYQSHAQQTIGVYNLQQHSHPLPHSHPHSHSKSHCHSRPHHYSQQNPPPQSQQQTSFSHTSPPDCSQPASHTSSPPDSSSFLRHPHDPRLVHTQYQPGSSYELAPDLGLPPNAGDLVPIQFQGLVPPSPPTIVQQPFVAFSPSDPVGPAPPFISTTDDPDFIQHHHHHHRLGGVLQFPGGYPIALMQDPELSILNAESYDDGSTNFRPPRSLPAGKSRAVTGSESTRSRKRKAQPQPADDDEPEEEEKKRSRGRPRLDTDDQTAKERRRTQIRLAQRAYRNRKETAIQTLEKKVDQLKSSNEEMSKAFMKLYDFAVSKGMLESTPEFGRQLQATTEKFVSLARRTGEDASNEAEGQPSQEHEESEGHEAGPEKHGDKSGSSLDAPQTSHVLYGGYMVENDAAALDISQSQAMAAVHTNSWAQDSQMLAARGVPSQAPLGYEIVTEPTPDNASFPFGMSLEGGLDTTHGQFAPSAQPFSESPFLGISAPSSYAYQERTFGRRLMRSTLERAYQLMRMPNPPPELVSAAFGFCLLFETREKIVERLANRLSVNQRETLFNWRFPFLHLGGGGTFFDDMTNEMHSMELPRRDRRLVGNQGSLEPDRLKVDSMFAMGPWDAATENVRDVRIDRKLRIVYPGFDGDFFDADEVEWVLQQRGVVIPPAADFVTAEIDPADFSEDANTEGRIFDPATGTFVANNMSQSAGPHAGSSSGEGHGFVRGSELSMNMMDTQPASMSSGSGPSPPMNLDPSLGGDVFGMESSSKNPAPSSGRSKRLVTVNVGVFVHEIGNRTVCLGRTPGVRPKDLNAAFWSSLAA